MTFAPLAEAQDELKLSLVIVEGGGAINNVRQRTARQPIVQVEDQNHKPIAGAAVLFALPSQGAGGTFAGGAQTLTLMTDQAGRAAMRGFRPNTIQGQYQIHVSASYQGKTANASISQSNAVIAGAAGAAGIGTGKLIAILVAGAAAVAGGVVAATRGGGGAGAAQIPTSSTNTTITPGTGTVGPPR